MTKSINNTQRIVKKIFKKLIFEKNIDNLNLFKKYLEQELEFPFFINCNQETRTGIDSFELKVNSIDDYFNEHYGIFFKGTRSRKKQSWPISDDWDYIGHHDKNEDLLDAYSDWYHNFC